MIDLVERGSVIVILLSPFSRIVVEFVSIIGFSFLNTCVMVYLRYIVNDKCVYAIYGLVLCVSSCSSWIVYEYFLKERESYLSGV